MNKHIFRLFSFAIFLILPLVVVLLTKNSLLVNVKGAAKDVASSTEIIVKYKAKTPDAEKEKLRKDFKTSLRKRHDKLRLEVVSVENGKVQEAINKYKTSPFVEYAEPDFKAEATVTTNDPSLSTQWGLFKIAAANIASQSAWDINVGNPSVKIAILDTGIESSHPDLSGKVIAESNFTTTSTVNDLDGHGTHTAGIAAAATNNGTGVAGSGYNSSLLNGKVLDDNGSGYYSWIISGIVWAADQGAQVISMSLSGSSASLALQDAVNYAWNKGSVVAAAAGNNGNSNANYPAYYNNVIAVASTDINDNKSSFSTYGSWIDVAAPGSSIYSTYKDGSYTTMSGTSMSTPFVAGVAALVWANGTCSTNTCVRMQIEGTADPINGTGTWWTWGRVNSYKALTNTVTPTPSPTATPTPTPSPTPTPAPTPQPTTKITANADSEVRKNSPSKNYGTQTQIEIDGDPVKIAYLKFDLAPLSGKSITSAKLRLRVSNSSSSIQNIKSVSDTSWTEGAITYNNRPSLGSSLSTISNSSSGTWKEVDITSYIQGKEGGFVSLGIDSTGSNDLGIYSRNSSSNKPELVVTY